MNAPPGAGSGLAGLLRRFTPALLSCAFLAATTAVPARAAGETINFDGLKSGEVVTNQYTGVGVEFGTSSVLKGPSPSSGDCGAPTVRAQVPAHSGSNYAVLPACLPAGPSFLGTYGALRHPSRSVSVYVSNVTVGTGSIKVVLVGFDEGKEIVSANGTASNGEWTQLTAEPSGSARISFFEVRTETTVTAGNLAIDDLSFESEPSSTPPPPPPHRRPKKPRKS